LILFPCHNGFGDSGFRQGSGLFRLLRGLRRFGYRDRSRQLCVLGVVLGYRCPDLCLICARFCGSRLVLYRLTVFQFLHSVLSGLPCHDGFRGRFTHG
jgi:hypothetical protein